MERDATFEDVWHEHRPHLLALATRMLGDAGDAEDAVQEAFDRLARVGLDDIDDPSGWLAVVVRHRCLDRIKSAHARHESAAGAVFAEAFDDVRAVDPVDRVTLDDQ